MKNEVLNQFVTEMLQLLQDAKSFASAQLPEVCKEVVLFGIVRSATLGVAILLLLIAMFVIARRCDKRNGGDGFAYLMAGMLGIAPLIGLFAAAEDLIRAVVAPRLYLIDYFKDLIK